jgi:hypothetical protein
MCDASISFLIGYFPSQRSVILPCSADSAFFEPKTAREAPAVEILLRKTKGVTIIT